MRISDWSSDVCSSDLRLASRQGCANGNVRGEYGMAERPILLVTRKLPSAVEERAARDYRARLNPEDAQFEAAVLIAGSAGADAILTCATEKFPAELIAALPDSVDRKRVVSGKGVSVRVVLGGRRILNTKTTTQQK